MTENKIKIIFFGTPRFAEIVLQKIIADKGYEVLGVVTTPDEPVGRKQILTAPAVKVLAEKNGLKVWQPEKLDEGFYKELPGVCHSEESRARDDEESRTRSFLPAGRQDDKHPGIDLFIVAAYGKIIPKKFLDLPKFGCLNIHPSLLPKYRGASPIQSALLNGEKETGVTIMKMDEEMDHGAIISNFQFPISNDDTYEILSEKLAQASGDFLLKIIPDYLTGKIEPREQDHDAATFCKIIKKSDGEIDWQKSAEQIYNQWRAFWPWPGAFADMKTLKHENIKTKFIELFLTDEKNEKHQPGELFAENDKLFVAGGDAKLLQILKLQPEGRNVLEAKEFINGYLK
jgi:methionyl-tRNA formyltransferase